MERDSGKMETECVNQKFAILIFRRVPVYFCMFYKCISRNILLLEILLYHLGVYL